MNKTEKQLWQITSRVGVTAGRTYGVYADTEKEAREIFRKKGIGMIVNIKRLSGHAKPSNMLNSMNENLAGAGTSADGGMSAPFSAMGQEIDSKRKEKPVPLGKTTTVGTYVTEDGIANAAGGGNVAGIGVGPQGEPGRPKELMPMVKRGKPFMGVETYLVPSRVFNQIREAKRKGKHWRKYLDEDDAFHHIRMEAKKNKKGAIIIEDENTGALCFAKYGSNV